jgi:hypothetical protein
MSFCTYSRVNARKSCNKMNLYQVDNFLVLADKVQI